MGFVNVKRIILIDESTDDLWLCRLVLERHGFDVLSLLDCENILKKMEVFSPTLIFINHFESFPSAVEIIRTIKSHAAFKDVPVVYFAGQAEQTAAAYEAGADELINKPYRLEELVQKAQMLITLGQ